MPANGPYSAYLLDALGATAEPLNHVQSAYFGHLARTLKADGIPAGLCGEGADSLFGLGLSNDIHDARVLRRLLPSAGLRKLVKGVAGVLGRGRLAALCRLADQIDDFTDLEHPINRVAAFTDHEATERCGVQALADTLIQKFDVETRFFPDPNPI